MFQEYLQNSGNIDGRINTRSVSLKLSFISSCPSDRCSRHRCYEEFVSIRETMYVANLSGQERKINLWQQMLKCVRPARHFLACLSEFKIITWYTISPANTSKEHWKLRRKKLLLWIVEYLVVKWFGIF